MRRDRGFRLQSAQTLADLALQIPPLTPLCRRQARGMQHAVRLRSKFAQPEAVRVWHFIPLVEDPGGRARRPPGIHRWQGQSRRRGCRPGAGRADRHLALTRPGEAATHRGGAGNRGQKRTAQPVRTDREHVGDRPHFRGRRIQVTQLKPGGMSLREVTETGHRQVSGEIGLREAGLLLGTRLLEGFRDAPPSGFRFRHGREQDVPSAGPEDGPLVPHRCHPRWQPDLSPSGSANFLPCASSSAKPAERRQ
jgi:hypothetical protein